jgi:hypothetical protein
MGGFLDIVFEEMVGSSTAKYSCGQLLLLAVISPPLLQKIRDSVAESIASLLFCCIYQRYQQVSEREAGQILSSRISGE